MSKKGNRRRFKVKSWDDLEVEGVCESSAISCSGTASDDVTDDVIVTSHHELLDAADSADGTKRKHSKCKKSKKQSSIDEEKDPNLAKKSQILTNTCDVKTDVEDVCPCCDVSIAQNREHILVLVDPDLCVIDAMNERRQCYRNFLGAATTKGAARPILHDERLCLKLASCQNYRQNTKLQTLIDPTRYFSEESLGKSEDAALYAKYGFDTYSSDVEEIDETESESEDSIIKLKCPCCQPETVSGDYKFEHLVFTCARTLDVKSAMNERSEAVRSLGDPHTNRTLHGLVQTYHDERLCSRLPGCEKYRVNRDSSVDPTTYFSVTKESAKLAGCKETLRVKMESDAESDEMQRYVESETTKLKERKFYGKFRLKNLDWVVVTRAPVENSLFPMDPKFVQKLGAKSRIPNLPKNKNEVLTGIKYDLPPLKIKNPKKAVKRAVAETGKVREFCPCCDQNTLEFAPGLKYAHCQFVIPRNVDPRAALKAREAFMIKETLEVRREYHPQKVRVTIHDERICAGLPSCHAFKTQDSDVVDPTLYFTDLRKYARGLCLDGISPRSIEPKIDFENLRCPCCERDEIHGKLDHGFEHIQYHLPEDLSLDEAMLVRHQFTETYESPQRFYRPVQLNFHDERLCLKLDSCLKDLCLAEKGYIDPTRYFTDKQLSKYESLILEELRVHNHGVQNECRARSVDAQVELRRGTVEK